MPEFRLQGGVGRPKTVGGVRQFPSLKDLDKENIPPPVPARAPPVRGQPIACAGTRANASPPAAKRPALMAVTGSRPNVKLYAFCMEGVRANENYVPVKLPAHRQLSPGWFDMRLHAVTASRLGAVAGFFEPKSATALGLSSRSRSPAAAAAAAREVINTQPVMRTEESVPMQWGRQHEANMLVPPPRHPQQDPHAPEIQQHHGA